MFVSSYNTYIQTGTSQKTDKEKLDKQNLQSNSFSSKLLQNTLPSSFSSSNLPVDYISKSQVLYNQREVDAQRQQLQEQPDKEFNQTKSVINRYSSYNVLLNAKSAYENNSKMFSLLQKPHVALDQTPKIDKSLPAKAQETKENHLRHVMVNTYLANDLYYKITA